jgi:hypothetical protein
MSTLAIFYINKCTEFCYFLYWAKKFQSGHHLHTGYLVAIFGATTTMRALADWRSGHRPRQWNGRSWVRISQGCKVFRTVPIQFNAVLCNLIRIAIVCFWVIYINVYKIFSKIFKRTFICRHEAYISEASPPWHYYRPNVESPHNDKNGWPRLRFVYSCLWLHPPPCSLDTN